MVANRSCQNTSELIPLWRKLAAPVVTILKMVFLLRAGLPSSVAFISAATSVHPLTQVRSSGCLASRGASYCVAEHTFEGNTAWSGSHTIEVLYLAL